MAVAFFCVERNYVVRAWSLWAPAGARGQTGGARGALGKNIKRRYL